MDKLFIVIRSDLPPGAQLAQGIHAMRAFVAAHPDVDRAWYESSNNIVVLNVPDAPALEQLLALGSQRGVPTAKFHEEDFGGELTAIAIGPSGKRLVANLPLALKAPPLTLPKEQVRVPVPTTASLEVKREEASCWVCASFCTSTVWVPAAAPVPAEADSTVLSETVAVFFRKVLVLASADTALPKLDSALCNWP